MRLLSMGTILWSVVIAVYQTKLKFLTSHILTEVSCEQS